MKILGIVCARAGSKGLKNKNMKLFNGKPLIYWTFEKLKKIKQLDKILVSTDDENIIRFAKKNNIDVIFKRPKYLSDSKASKIDVWRHAYKKAENYYNIKFDAVFDIDCSNPLQKLKSIKKLVTWSMKKIRQKHIYDLSLFITKSRKSPYFNMFEKKQDYMELSKNIGSVHSRQSSPIVYDHIAGSYFILNNFLKTKKYLNKAKIIGYEINRDESFDIDDILDFKICERIYKSK